MGSAEQKNASMFQKNVRERLAELLITLDNHYGVEENGHRRLDIKLSREEIAGLIGTATETVIRFITEFKEEGIIDQEGKNIFIINEDKLRQFANIKQ